MAEGDSSHEKFQVAYVGEDPSDHTMDAEELGPALLAFGKLIRAANAELNRDRATVKVLVSSNFEHRCFNINFEVIQTVLDSLRDLVGDKESVENIKEILKRIGVIATGGSIIGGSLFAYLKWRKGRKVEKVENSPNALIVKVEGDNNVVHVDRSVFQLSQNRDVLQAVDWTLAPVKAGTERAIEFREDHRPVNVLQKEDVEEIIASIEALPEPIQLPQKEKPKVVTATLYVYGPVFDPKAPMWRFLYKGKPIYADIKDTSIAVDAVKRGGSFVNDRYKVKMEVIPADKPDGAPHYKIIEVLEFTQAEQQMGLPLKRRRTRGGRAAKRS